MNNNRMKIVQIGAYPMDKNCIRGGVETSVYGLSCELALLHDVQIFDLPRKAIAKNQQICNENGTVFRMKAFGANIFSFLRIKSYIRAIKQFHPDICHLHSTSLFCFILFLCLKLNRQKCILTVHGLAYVEKQKVYRSNKSLVNLFKLLYQSVVEFAFLSLCPVVIVDTAYVADEISRWGKSRKLWRMPEMHVIPQGVNSQFFNQQTAIDPNLMLSVGALSKRKGHRGLIEAMAKVVAVNPDSKLIIAGVVSEAAYYDAMLSDIEKLKLTQSVQIIPDASLDQIMNLYRQAAVFVLHSAEESQGIVLCEAMALGLPIVSTLSGGIPWVVKDGVNGYLSEYGDLSTFADNMLILLSDVSLRQQIAAKNVDDAHRYQWAVITSKIVTLYRSVMHGSATDDVDVKIA